MHKSAFSWQHTMIGRYRLEQPLGRGGMGEVWHATDTHLGRPVAIKLLHAVRMSNRGYLDEFVNEARAAAALEHPHILALHDFGEQSVNDGEVVPFLVMPFVNSGTLRQRIQSAHGILPVQTSLYFLRQAAQAIDYAHGKQVLHRDIKPENMLLQQDWLLLSDFGLAKILSSTTIHEKTHARAGTPEYMAPERIQGEALPASDLYSLAIIAYQLFTGQHPFRGATPIEIFLKQMESMPPPPRQLNAAIPEIVEQVLLHGLAKQPQDRPASCLIFVDALQAGWRIVEPDVQDPDSTLLSPRSRRWQTISQGLPTPALPESILPDITTPPLDSHATVSVPDMITADMAGTPTMPHPVAGKPQRKFGRREALIGGVAAGTLLLAAAATTTALVNSHNSGSGQQTLQTKPVPGPRKLIPGVPVLALTGHTTGVWVAKWDPTRRYLVTAAGDQNVMLWDMATALRSSTPQTLHSPLRTYNIAGTKFENTNDGLCWSLDGRKLIASQGFNEKAYVLDITDKSGTPEAYTDQVGVSMGASLIYDGVCAGPGNDHFTVISDNFLQVWRIGKTNIPERNLITDKNMQFSIAQMQWSADGSTLAALASLPSDSLRLLLWRSGQLMPQVVDLAQRSTYLTFFRMTDTVAWSPVDPNLLLVSDANIAIVADLHQKKIVLVLGLSNSQDTPVLGGLSWSPNGRYIAGTYAVQGDSSHGSTFNPKIYIWDVEKLRKNVSPTATTVAPQDPTLSFTGQGALHHTQSIVDLQWSPDGRYLASASLDKTVLIWKVDEI